MIKYVVDNSSMSGSDARVQSTDSQGQTIINTEIEILTSLDVAKKVAEDIGPEKILARFGGGRDVMRAAGFINGHMKVEAETKSSVIAVDFKHPDPDMVQPVLSEIIKEYKNKHREVHQPGTVGDVATVMTDKFKNDLADIERDLRKAKESVGVVSVDAALQQYSQDMQKARQNISEAEAELVQRSALVNAMTTVSFGKPAATNANTNLSATHEQRPVPAQTAEDYARICRRLTTLWALDDDLIKQGYREASAPVASNRSDIAIMEAQKQKLEADFPSLRVTAPQVASSRPASEPASSQPTDPTLNITSQAAHITGLQSTIDFWKSQLKDLQE